MSAHKAPHEKKIQQMNVRFTAREAEELDEIAAAEDRDRAYLVGFFTRWGMEQYRRAGSLMVLRTKNVPREERFREISEKSVSRLKLREEASKEDEESDGRSTYTKRAR